MKGNTSKGRWIGFGLVGALAVTATAVTVVFSGQHPAGAVDARPAATKAPLFTGVWAPGSGSQVWRTKMSATSLSTWDRTYVGKSLRIQDLRVSPGGTDYTAVWRPGTGTQVVKLGLTSSQFVADNASYAKKGLKLTSLDTSHSITAVWRPRASGTPAQTVVVRLTTAHFQSRLQTLAKAGLRPAFADYYKKSGVANWIGVFEHGSGSAEVRTTSSATVWHNDVAGYYKDGLRLAGLGSTLYTGVWRPGKGGQQVWTATQSTFENDIAKYYHEGYRLVRIGSTF
ncbi:MAG TPA: hypothetical protein VHX59_20055 [Mycobacteriales bacterium]|jgi:hypothetical protein|nr:hypothetical protein [Mycobacteriales bacterium]